MSVQLLDNTRMINQLLQSSSADKVIFSDICNVMSRIFSGHVLVISRKGKVLGAGRTVKGAEEDRLLPGKVGTFVDAKFSERLLSILSTNDNVNLETLGFDKEKARDYKAIVSPVFIAGERLGTLFIYTTASGFDIDSIILCEYGATVIGMAMRQSVNEEYAEEARKQQIVKSAISTLSFSETEAIEHIFAELKGSEGILVASKIADRVGITRSVIVNALRKLESAGVIESRSSGMRGTYIKVLNESVFTELESMKKKKQEKA